VHASPEIGSMGKGMGKGHTHGQIVITIRGIGGMIKYLVRVALHMRMGLILKGDLLMDKNYD